MAAPAPDPAWKGFTTFILNASIPNYQKEIIIYIFASKLYNCTTLLDYNLRLLNAHVHHLDSKDTTKNIKTSWVAFIKNITNVGEVNTIATMLLVLINHHTDGSNKIKMDDAYDSTKGTFITNITPATPFNAPAAANSVASLIQSLLNPRIPGIEKRLFNWSGFETLFTNISVADARSYICNYFIAELNDTKAPNANEDSDAYILFKQLIIENDDDSHINALDNEVKKKKKDATFINTLSKNLKYLFEYTDIATNIETKTVDALKCFGDADIELIKTLDANAPAKTIPKFDKNTLPVGWQLYNMVNIASYNIAGLDTKPKIDNVIAFLTNVTAGKAPEYDKFRPDIITLQNTTELMADATYKTLKTNKNYWVLEHKDSTSMSADKLITLIKKDYFVKDGTTYNNTPTSGYLDAAPNQYYLASVIQKYKIIVINVVDKTGAKIPFTNIFDAAIKNIKKKNDISNYDILITGTIKHDDKSPEYIKNYEKSICKYDSTNVTDSYIISTGFKQDTSNKYIVYPYDFKETDTAFETNYSTSRPIGKRMFQDPAKAPKKAPYASSNKSGLKITFTSLLDDIATELDKLSQREINKILASVSAPNTAPAAPKKKTTSAKATPVATPPKGAPVAKTVTLDIPKINEIDFTSVGKFNLDDYKTVPSMGDYAVYNKGASKFNINIKVKISGTDTDINIDQDALYVVNTIATAFMIKLTHSGTDYYITGITITNKIQINISSKDYTVKHIPPTGTPVKKISMYTIKEINFKNIQNLMTGTPPANAMAKITDFHNNCDATKYIQFKTGKSGSKKDKKIHIISNEGDDKQADVFKVDKEDRYCIKVKIGSTIHAVHDILIKGDKVYYHDTTPPGTDFDITKDVTTY